MQCSLVRLSTPTSPSIPGLLLVGALRLQAERLTSRVGSISPTSSDTKRDFYSALPFDGAAAVVWQPASGSQGVLCKLSSAFKKSAQETGAQIASAFADLHLEHVPPQLNQGDSRGAKDGRVYRH